MAKEKKWLKRRIRDSQSRIMLEGNKGGDFVELIPMENGRVYLHSGCSCVTTIDMVVPNEFLSILLKDCILNYGSVREYLGFIDYDDDYKRELISKVSERTN